MNMLDPLTGYSRWVYRVLYGVAIALLVFLVINIVYDKYESRKDTASAVSWQLALANARHARAMYEKQVLVSRILNDSLVRADSITRSWKQLARAREQQLKRLPVPAIADSMNPVWMHRDQLAEATLAVKDSIITIDSISINQLTRDRNNWHMIADTLKATVDTVTVRAIERIAVVSRTCRFCPSRKVSAAAGVILGILGTIFVNR